MKMTRLHTALFATLFASLLGQARAEEAPASDAAATPAPAESSVIPAASESAPAPAADAARDALKQQEGDATVEKNLDEVFQSAQKSYSLLKQGKVGLQYDVDYSYYRDSRVDIAISDNSSTLTRFRIQEDAQHTISNNFDVTYGVRNNLTLSMSVPLVTKFDTQSDLSTTGLGDVGLGLRWQPVPLKRGLPSTTLFAGLSTATGDSPYEINVSENLATGKGYYSLSMGGSMSKVADPIVLFASASYSTSTQVSGLDQLRGGRILNTIEPGDSIGGSMGLAYSLNYDVSVTASYQQSYGFSTKFTFSNGDYVSTAPSTSSMLNFSLGLRTNPKRIVNVNLGYGLTEDTPDVTLGFSMPIDFLGADAE